MGIGIEAVTYLNGGTWDVPDWNPVTSIKDWQVTPNWNKVAIEDRGAAVVYQAKTNQAISVTGSLNTGSLSDAANVSAFLAALATRDGTLDLMVLNGPMTEDGVRGYRMHWTVTGGDQDQGTQSDGFTSVTLDPAPPPADDERPQSVLVSAGNPVFTTIEL